MKTIIRTNAVPMSVSRRNTFGYWEAISRKTMSGFYYSAAGQFNGTARSSLIETRQWNSKCWDYDMYHNL